jgi:DMSO/TMAO reductase YedYZ molybdopterin-dependent catalytic subunit
MDKPANTTAADIRHLPEAQPIGAGATGVSPVELEIRRLTRRSFATAAIAGLAGAAGVGWVATRELEDGVPWPLRRVLEFNQRVAQTFFSDDRLSPEFPLARATEPRENGHVGLMSSPTLANWTITVSGNVERRIPLAVIKELPAYEMTTEFRCVEGWSRVVNWKGVRLADLLNKYGAPGQYVGLSTPPDALTPSGQPDRYYVGLDRPSAMHPQSLLAYEMNGAPLTLGHGAPLRLVSTVKYGYKCIKRVSLIEITDHRPADYWAQRGYDWYGGH